MRGQLWTSGQRVILPMKSLLCGQCGQCVLMSVNLKMYVILSNYTVGVWLTNAHTPWFRQRLKKGRPHCPQAPHESTTSCHQATSQRATGSCGHCPHDPPLKYYKLQAGGRVPVASCFLAEGPRVGPSAKGHGSGRGVNKIFYSPHCPHCPHDPQIFNFIFGIFGTCLKAYLLHRARLKRLRRA